MKTKQAKNESTKINLVAISLPENMQDWILPPHLDAVVSQIHCVYMLDANRVDEFNRCVLWPHSFTYDTEDGEPLPDESHDEMLNVLNAALADELSNVRTKSFIDNMIDNDPGNGWPGYVFVYGKPGFYSLLSSEQPQDEEAYQLALDELREYLDSNGTF